MRKMTTPFFSQNSEEQIKSLESKFPDFDISNVRCLLLCMLFPNPRFGTDVNYNQLLSQQQNYLGEVEVIILIIPVIVFPVIADVSALRISINRYTL